jgi:hypothetical protein
MYCVPWGGALSHNKLDTKKKKNNEDILEMGTTAQGAGESAVKATA